MADNTERKRLGTTYVDVTAEELIRQISEEKILYYKVVMDTGDRVKTVESLRRDEVTD